MMLPPSSGSTGTRLTSPQPRLANVARRTASCAVEPGNGSNQTSSSNTTTPRANPAAGPAKLTPTASDREWVRTGR